ncbi:MAG TPA: hypothetical protein PLP39_01650 [Flavobacterium lutivivi]|jgi:hypothetical protein|nr:hypothetical protein [Flavobacterium lutivivi]
MTKAKSKVSTKSKGFDAKMNAIYIERLERFMALVELSFALKNAPRISKEK